MMEYRISEQIVSDIQNKIEKGLLSADDKLPSERELSQQYGISRNAVRESIKILAEKNLVVNIPGKGNYVSKPTADSISSKLESAIKCSDFSIKDVINARLFLEINMIDSYLNRIKKSQLMHLEALYEAMNANQNNYALFSEYDTQFHLYLIQCSDNEVLTLFFSTLYNMTYKNIITDSPNPRKVIQISQKDHRAIIDAIIAKDSEKLKKTMKKHIEPLYDLYKNN